MPRFDPHARTHADAATYLTERAIQLLKHGFVLRSLERRELGVVAIWELTKFKGNPDMESAVRLHGTQYTSLYLLEQHRGAGLYRKLVKEEALPVLTHVECGLAPYLAAHHIPFVVASECPEYGQVLGMYGDHHAMRSKVWYMRHIDEGLAVLLYHGGHEMAHGPVGQAFCLHPLVQKDRDLMAHWKSIQTTPDVMALAMEYRSVANRALVHHPLPITSSITLSTLAEVNHMLVADKIQNRKDFYIHHFGSHPRSMELERYFKLWLGRLQVFEETYQAWVGALRHPMNVLDAFLKASPQLELKGLGA